MNCDRFTTDPSSKANSTEKTEKFKKEHFIVERYSIYIYRQNGVSRRREAKQKQKHVLWYPSNIRMLDLCSGSRRTSAVKLFRTKTMQIRQRRNNHINGNKRPGKDENSKAKNVAQACVP